jgi:hypothetical protein
MKDVRRVNKAIKSVLSKAGWEKLERDAEQSGVSPLIILIMKSGYTSRTYLGYKPAMASGLRRRVETPVKMTPSEQGFGQEDDFGSIDAQTSLLEAIQRQTLMGGSDGASNRMSDFVNDKTSLRDEDDFDAIEEQVQAMEVRSRAQMVEGRAKLFGKKGQPCGSQEDERVGTGGIEYLPAMSIEDSEVMLAKGAREDREREVAMKEWAVRHAKDSRELSERIEAEAAKRAELDGHHAHALSVREDQTSERPGERLIRNAKQNLLRLEEQARARKLELKAEEQEEEDRALEEMRPELFKDEMMIGLLKLGARAENVLFKQGINSIGQLRQKTADELASYKGLGSRSIYRIMRCLHPEVELDEEEPKSEAPDHVDPFDQQD